MKKVLFIGLLIVVTLSVLLCPYGEANKDNSTKAETDSAKSDVQSTPELANLTLNSYDEYRKFYNKDNHSKAMIGYEALKQIGKFQSLVILSINPEDFSKIYYSFEDSSGFTVSLTIIDLSKEESSIEKVKQYSPELEETDGLIDYSNLRNLKKDISGNVTMSDMKYYYVLGKLLSIEWQYNNYEFCLSGTGYLNDYPDVSGTFVSRLLKKETCREGVDSLMMRIWETNSTELIQYKETENFGMKNVLPIVIVIAVIAVALAVAVVVKRESGNRKKPRMGFKEN